MNSTTHIIMDYQAKKFCACSETQSSSKDLITGWLRGAISRGSLNAQHSKTTAHVYQSIYRCGSCRETVNILVLVG